jgi:hypothetical protein
VNEPHIQPEPSSPRALPRSENVERFIRAVEEVTGIPFEVLAERANVELEERQREARKEVLEYLGESAAVTPEEAEQIRREWQEYRSILGRSSRLSAEAGECRRSGQLPSRRSSR